MFGPAQHWSGSTQTRHWSGRSRTRRPSRSWQAPPGPSRASSFSLLICAAVLGRQQRGNSPADLVHHRLTIAGTALTDLVREYRSADTHLDAHRVQGIVI